MLWFRELIAVLFAALLALLIVVLVYYDLVY